MRKIWFLAVVIFAILWLRLPIPTVARAQFFAPALAPNTVAGSVGYSYYRAITLNAATYNPATQTNFPVLVCANGSGVCNASVVGLNQSGGGAHVKNSSGYDVTFWTSSSCTGSVSWEMENYVAATGEMEAWVLIPTLGTSNQTIYMCYGNAGISTFQGGAAGAAWNANFAGVYHLNGSGPSVNDSTSNASNGTIVGSVTAVTGNIDGGAGLSGSSTYITLPSAIAVVIGKTPTAWTISQWVNFSSSTAIQQTFGGIPYSGFPDLGIGVGGCGSLLYMVVGQTSCLGSTSVPSTSAWHLLTWTYAGTSNILYVDGVSAATGAFYWEGGDTSGGTIGIGGNGGLAAGMSGSTDELEISSVALSPNWITAQVNNQSSPSTFETFGSEVP